MEEENIVLGKKPNNMTKIIAIIGIVLVLIGGGFVIYKKLTNKEKNEKEKSGEVEKSNDEMNLETYPYLYVVTAKYGATDEYKEFIDKIFGENAEQKFRVYFQWYNVFHELTHGIINYNSDMKISEHQNIYGKEGYLEEQKVNDFAVAYWKKYGDSEKIQLLKESVNYILSNMTDPTNGTLSTAEYGKQLWESGNPDSSFEAYGWFQFNSVKEALEKELTIEEAMKNLGVTKEVNFDEEKLSYGNVDETVCEQIINDSVNKLKKWGLNYPKVYHIYDDDPNTNYSNPITTLQYNYYSSLEK